MVIVINIYCRDDSMKSHKVCYAVLLLQKFNLRETDCRNVVLCALYLACKGVLWIS